MTDELFGIMFPLREDSYTAVMLRALCAAGSMPQAEFMRDYHAVCVRRCRTCKDIAPASGERLSICPSCRGTGIDPQRSSFTANFGRFTRPTQSSVYYRGAYMTSHRPSKIRCIAPSKLPPKREGGKATRNLLTWSAGSRGEIVASMSADQLSHAEQLLERVAIEADGSLDWLMAVRAEMVGRTTPSMEIAA